MAITARRTVEIPVLRVLPSSSRQTNRIVRFENAATLSWNQRRHVRIILAGKRATVAVKDLLEAARAFDEAP